MTALDTLRADLDHEMGRLTRQAFADLLQEVRDMCDAFEEENEVRPEPRRKAKARRR